MSELSPPAFLEEARRSFHAALLRSVLVRDSKGIVSNADKSNANSKSIASGIADLVGVHAADARLVGQMSGRQFESVCAEFLRTTFLRLDHLRPGAWIVENLSPTARTKKSGQRAGKHNRKSGRGLADYYQYRHLGYLAELAADNRHLAAALGNDYIITPDIVIARRPEPDDVINRPTDVVSDQVSLHSTLREWANKVPILHATISCKWTMRSDRAQNARTEGLNLIRHRKGPTPQIAVVTGEPLPTRIASLAFGVGDIDCVYHFALNELLTTVTSLSGKLKLSDHLDLLHDMIDGNRLKDISDLPLDLAI